MDRDNIRKEFFTKMKDEKVYQVGKWGYEADGKNTQNDWIAYICTYLGKCNTYPVDNDNFKKMMVKVATLAMSAYEQFEIGEFGKLHWEK